MEKILEMRWKLIIVGIIFAALCLFVAFEFNVPKKIMARQAAKAKFEEIESYADKNGPREAVSVFCKSPDIMKGFVLRCKVRIHGRKFLRFYQIQVEAKDTEGKILVTYPSND